MPFDQRQRYRAGKPAGQRDYIFEPFAPGDESRTRIKSGTGLGLAIARQFAALFGGEVTVAREIGRGSTFTLRLPLA